MRIAEYINSLLSSGDIPGLFTAKEMDALLVPLKETYAKYGVAKFKNIQDFFIHRVRANLHVVLSMDFKASEFAMRCESNPAIYTQCAIIWSAGWSKPGLKHVRDKHFFVCLFCLGVRFYVTDIRRHRDSSNMHYWE